MWNPDRAQSGDATVDNGDVNVIWFGGHRPKGGYDVHKGRNNQPATARLATAAHPSSNGMLTDRP
jgi:hypothetical protein